MNININVITNLLKYFSLGSLAQYLRNGYLNSSPSISLKLFTLQEIPHKIINVYLPIHYNFVSIHVNNINMHDFFEFQAT